MNITRSMKAPLDKAGKQSYGLKKYEAMSKISVLSEFWQFLKLHKRWWLAPIVFFLLLLGSLIFISEGSVLAPFIYTLF